MIPKSVSKLYIVCYDGADALRQYVVKLTYNISTKNIANKYSDPR